MLFICKTNESEYEYDLATDISPPSAMRRQTHVWRPMGDLWLHALTILLGNVRFRNWIISI